MSQTPGGGGSGGGGLSPTGDGSGLTGITAAQVGALPVSGNAVSATTAGTASSLSATGFECASGSYSRGIDIYGNAIGCTVAGSGGGGSVLSGITAATNTNSINNSFYQQGWYWQLSVNNETGFTFGESAISSATNTNLVKVVTNPNSLAHAFIVRNGNGNNNNIDTNTNGDINISGSDTDFGSSIVTPNGGSVNITGGRSTSPRNSGNVNISGGNNTASGASAGSVNIDSGQYNVSSRLSGQGIVNMGSNYATDINIGNNYGTTTTSILGSTLNIGNSSTNITTVNGGNITVGGASSPNITVGSGVSGAPGIIVSTVGAGGGTTSINASGGLVQIGSASSANTMFGHVFLPNIPSSSAALDYLCFNSSNGYLTYDTTTCTTSDIRYKENVKTITYGLEEVLKLRPVTYDLKKEANPHGMGRKSGFIAGEVESVDKTLAVFEVNQETGKMSKTLRGVDYNAVTPLLVSAIQEQQKEIERLTKQIKSLIIKNHQKRK